jgi:hypothetical protein
LIRRYRIASFRMLAGAIDSFGWDQTSDDSGEIWWPEDWVTFAGAPCL